VDDVEAVRPVGIDRGLGPSAAVVIHLDPNALAALSEADQGRIK